MIDAFVIFNLTVSLILLLPILGYMYMLYFAIFGLNYNGVHRFMLWNVGGLILNMVIDMAMLIGFYWGVEQFTLPLGVLKLIWLITLFRMGFYIINDFAKEKSECG